MKQTRLSTNINALKIFMSEWGFSWNGLKTNKSGEWLLIIQIILVLAHLSPPKLALRNFGITFPVYLNLVGSIIVLIAFLVCIYSILSLGSNLSPLPEPKGNASLITNRSYKYCRHPLYFSLILMSIGVNIWIESLFHLFLLICLSVILISKAKWEESKLKIIYPDYKKYMSNTPAIIKGIMYFDWRE